MHRVLKPTESILITTPNLAAFGRRLLLFTNNNPHIEISFTNEAAGHNIRYFIKKTLFALLEKHSFKPYLFTSDIVNFNAKETIRNQKLAKFFPTIGSSLIIKATKIQKT